MDVYTIIRTSSDTAECDPIVLRETSTIRLLFKPMLVNNAHDANAPVRGTFIHQRKGPAESWENYSELPLSRLRASEWVKLDLGAGEIHKLIQHIAGLYRLYRKHGLPVRKAHFIRIDLEDSESSVVTRLDIGRLIEISRRTGVDVFAQLVEWTAEHGNAVELLKHLKELDINTLQRLNSLVGITSLKSVLETWESNQTNSNEEFWQNALEQNAFVLSQVFSFPILIIRGKAYIGDKMIDNTGGHLADFLAENPVTRNVIIIEIKTPGTNLLGRKYRMDVYSASEELSGAILQVLNYRYNLMTEFLSIRRGREELFDVFSPHCLVVAGHARRQLQTENHVRSFEMFRSSHKDVIVVTYDELFEKTRQLLQTLEGTVINGSKR